MVEAAPSQIPVSVKRRSMGPTTPMGPPALPSSSSTNALNGRATSPLATRPPSTHGSRRHSLLPTPRSRQASLNDATLDDPAILRAQIDSLRVSLKASHQRILELTSGLSPNTPSETSPSSVPLSPAAWTPIHALTMLSEADGEQGKSKLRAMLYFPLILADSTIKTPLSAGQCRIPKSDPIYDLRGKAVTATPAKPTDARLGLSRIPQSVVSHSLTLHASPAPSPAAPTSRMPSPSPQPSSAGLQSPFLNLNSPRSTSGGDPSGRPEGSTSNRYGRYSPAVEYESQGLRRSSGPVNSAASTKVIDGLQTELLNAKSQLERAKQDVRSSRRVIDQLTRQTEDLKETRERMRIECEGLNNVVARKERLLQEVLDRARTAESTLAEHASTRKALEQSTKKSLQQMTAQLKEAQLSQQRSEREAVSLRDSVKSLRDVWAREVRAVREEMKRGEEKGLREREEARTKHLALVKLVQAQSADRQSVQQLFTDAKENANAASASFQTQIAALRMQLDNSEAEARSAKEQARDLAADLVRLRRMMRGSSRPELAALAESSTRTDTVEHNSADTPLPS